MWILEGSTPTSTLHFQLGDGTHLLGRAPDAALHIPDPSLSRRHAELRVGSDGLWIRDLGSQNGTQVDSARIDREVRLKLGSRITCGDVRLAVQWNGTSKPAGAGGLPATFSTSHPSHTVALNEPPAVDEGPVAQRLATLLKVGELLAVAGGDRGLERRILELLSEILPLGRAALLRVERGDELVLAAAWGDAARPYSESIVRHVIAHGVAASFDDALLDDRLGGQASLMVENVRSAMCAPLRVGGQTLGALYVDNQVDAHLFDRSDLDLMAGFANQAALALHSARLQVQLRELAVRESTLERFFPKATVERLLADGGDLGVQELPITALFSDISGFTALSSTLPPAEVVALLHAYFPPMAEIIFDRAGTLEKYIGDALLAVWGAPFRQPDDADRALDAAVEMQRALDRMRQDLPHAIEIHVGLHSGTAALANIGSPQYLQIATIGDATNVAARVCAAAQVNEILISRATRDLLRRSSCPMTELPPVRVKGKEEPLQLFRVDWRA